jgi:hypothetical protein
MVQLHRELEVAYCRLVTITTDNLSQSCVAFPYNATSVNVGASPSPTPGGKALVRTTMPKCSDGTSCTIVAAPVVNIPVRQRCNRPSVS